MIPQGRCGRSSGGGALSRTQSKVPAVHKETQTGICKISFIFNHPLLITSIITFHGFKIGFNMHSNVTIQN